MRPGLRNGVRGYEISAYRTFTTAMIHDLKEDTKKYEKDITARAAPMVSEEGCYGAEEEAEMEVENIDEYMDWDNVGSGHAQASVDEEEGTFISSGEMDDSCNGDFVQSEA